MKTYSKFYPIVVLIVLFFIACNDDDKVRKSTPVIDSIELSHAEALLMPDTLRVNAEVSDAVTPLSTLEVETEINGVIVNQLSIRTKGHEAVVEDEIIFIDFLPDVDDEDDIKINFTLINIDGYETKQTKTIKARRPTLPATLYLVDADGKITLTLRRDSENQHLYKTNVSDYDRRLTGKLSMNRNINNSKFIWNGSGDANHAVIGERWGEDISLAFPNWNVSQYIFDALSFTFSVGGEEIKIYVNEELLTGEGDYFYGEVAFEKDKEFAITGLDEQQYANAWNRDFFEYNEAAGTFKFLRETGTWQVYYSLDYNYLQVMKMTDAAPACYWVVGHGFTCAPVWNTDFAIGGWDMDIPGRLGYAVPIGGTQYQVSIYINNAHEWDSFEFEIYKDLLPAEVGEDGEEIPKPRLELTAASLSGDTQGFEISQSSGLTNDADFVPGYYRLTFDSAGSKCHIERLGEN